MPELPEVNTLAVALNKQLLGDSIKNWQRLSPRLRCPIPGAEDAASLIGKPVKAVKRIAKSLYFDFGCKLLLHVHLGMTGSFNLTEEESSELRHEHLRIKLASGRVLSYFDPRRFGVIELCSLPEVLVVEPFVGNLTDKYLASLCRRSERSIKSLIMDQQILAGLGNIYATEALFVAGILPFRAASSLAGLELLRLTRAIIEVTDAAVKSGLHSLEPDYLVNADTTHFPIITNVYGQQTKLCPKCHSGIIKRQIIAGRSSCYCPLCQK